MTTIDFIHPSAAAPCTRTVSDSQGKKIAKSAASAAVSLGVGKKKRAAKMPTDPVKTVKTRAKRTGTKQERVNQLVKAVLDGNTRTLDKNFKQEIIGEIMNLCEMTHAGATTYFYNAMKTL